MKASTLLVIAPLLVGPAAAEGPAGPVGLKLTPVLETATTITGQPIRFPQGENQYTAVIAEVAPGGQVGRHMHPVPLFVYMLEGMGVRTGIDLDKLVDAGRLASTVVGHEVPSKYYRAAVGARARATGG